MLFLSSNIKKSYPVFPLFLTPSRWCWDRLVIGNPTVTYILYRGAIPLMELNRGKATDQKPTILVRDICTIDTPEQLHHAIHNL